VVFKKGGRFVVRVLLVLFLLAVMVLPLIPKPVYADGGVFGSSHSLNGQLKGIEGTYGAVWNKSESNFKRIGTQNEMLGQYYDGVNYYGIGRWYIYIDTSSIPDTATITSASLSIEASSIAYLDKDFNLTLQNGQPTFPHNPLVKADFERDYYSGDGGSINTTTITQLFTPYNISLTPAGLSWINKEGYTKFVLRSSRDINGIAPTGDEWLWLYNYADSLTLYATWAATGPPSVTTRSAQYITVSLSLIHISEPTRPY